MNVFQRKPITKFGMKDKQKNILRAEFGAKIHKRGENLVERAMLERFPHLSP